MLFRYTKTVHGGKGQGDHVELADEIFAKCQNETISFYNST